MYKIWGILLENKPSVFIHLMNESLNGIDVSSISSLKVSTEWVELQVLTDPFVVYRNEKYLPVVLVEESTSESKHILYVSAKSLAEFLESLRSTRGALVGLNIRIRKKGEEKFALYEIEELAD
jgi:hypothetical protein